jgi:hypothetical protein
MRYATSELDKEAKRLYQRFDGLDDPREFFVSEQEQVNDWRKCMVDFAYLLSYTLNNSRVNDTILRRADDYKPMIKRLKRMTEIPQWTEEPKLTIRHRGLGLVHHHANKDDEETLYDYVIACGDCVVDKPYIKYLVQNKIIDAPGLIVKLDKAFQFFANAGIYIIEVDLADWDRQKEKLVSSSLMVWARYISDLSKDSKRVVYDELNRPDPNLTILAKLNRFRRKDLQKLVQQIHQRYMN